jgi:hypothetical protein
LDERDDFERMSRHDPPQPMEAGRLGYKERKAERRSPEKKMKFWSSAAAAAAEAAGGD